MDWRLAAQRAWDVVDFVVTSAFCLAGMLLMWGHARARRMAYG